MLDTNLKNTLRVVLFMNEETVRGGLKYEN
jgi:hypothetical protein